MHRTLNMADTGPDVALFQRDLNAFYRYWDAPARALLTMDGSYGPQTDLAWRRVRLRLGLEEAERHGQAVATPRARVVARHVGRYLLAKERGDEYVIPAPAARTNAEVRRGLAAKAYEKKLRERFHREQAAVTSKDAHRMRIVRNRSSRNGVKPRIVVLHSTESHNRPGFGDLEGLAAWFDDPGAQASSHIGNDAEGNDIRMVPDEAKAWTQAAFNSVALSIEQVGQAVQTSWPRPQLENTATWIAHWGSKWDIPLVQSTQHGVCQHSHLGPRGGGHHDCGSSYPLAEVLQMARTIQAQGA